MRTPVCAMLGIDFPLLAVSHCGDVVAAVTNAAPAGPVGGQSGCHLLTPVSFPHLCGARCRAAVALRSGRMAHVGRDF
jgi:hypothetical protein